tara:strand:- start:1644 stop:1901 length:258 start_codon:yes stop_codon:yes gene_type:complete
METLKLKETNKNEAIKKINAFRLENKNKWYQVELNYNPFIYKMKVYNTWVQLFYCYEGNELKYNNPSEMDMKVGEFKNFLQNSIK